MKLLVVSDVHGRHDRLERVMQMHRDSDALIFLGDGLRDLEQADAYSYPFTVFAVRGNCDGFSLFTSPEAAPTEICVTLGGVKIFALHGHTRSVKSGLGEAMIAANEREARLMLYGHTHREDWSYYPEGRELPNGDCLTAPLHVFNPGSLGQDGSFGVIDIVESGIMASCGRI